MFLTLGIDHKPNTENDPAPVIHNFVELDCSDNLFEQIKCLKPSLVDDRGIVWSFGDGPSVTHTDGFGRSLTFVLARDFDKIVLYTPMTAWNQAAVVYMQSIPSDSRVYLYWH